MILYNGIPQPTEFQYSRMKNTSFLYKFILSLQTFSTIEVIIKK
jgi:hypothetical protein